MGGGRMSWVVDSQGCKRNRNQAPQPGVQLATWLESCLPAWPARLARPPARLPGARCRTVRLLRDWLFRYFWQACGRNRQGSPILVPLRVLVCP
jgi:hypothetical protein